MIRTTVQRGAPFVLLWLFVGNSVFAWLGNDNVKSKKQKNGQSDYEATGSQDQNCFCHLTGILDDCFCDVESIDIFNNFKIYPRIRKLTERDYFRYYKVNLKRPCPFWPDDSQCSIKDCQVEPCPESKVPVGIKAGNYNKYSQASNTRSDVEECEHAHELGAINSTLSNQSREAFEDWARHDDAQDHFCELDGASRLHGCHNHDVRRIAQQEQRAYSLISTGARVPRNFKSVLGSTGQGDTLAPHTHLQSHARLLEESPTYTGAGVPPMAPGLPARPPAPFPAHILKHVSLPFSP